MHQEQADISTILLVLRRLRRTLITLVLIFAVAVLGLTLVPGPIDDNGQVTRLGFFHAFYFISYTATTIGFGEVPEAFSEQQRLWVTVCIYLSVIGWAIFVSSLLQLAQDESLKAAMRIGRFRRAVRRIREPFYLVCGYGETGQRVARAIDRMGARLVVLDIDPGKLVTLELQPYEAEVLTLAADASSPVNLAMAGLGHYWCRGVLALTNDDEANLAVAIAAHLVAPKLRVLARARTRETVDNMASFGTAHIIHPVKKFGDYLSLAMHSPGAYHLMEWLTGLPGSAIDHRRDPPTGNWVLCGYGNFGRSLASAITREGQPVAVIDLRPETGQGTPGAKWIQGDGTGGEALSKAGVTEAVGIIAATSSDVNNLSIAVTARQLNPDIFVIVRRNSSVNRMLMEACSPDITIVPSEIVAQECLAILTTPMLTPFLNEILRAEDTWCQTLFDQLAEEFGPQAPEVWGVRVNLGEAPALYRRLMQGAEIALGDVLVNHSRRDLPLDCRILRMERDDDEKILLPAGDTPLQPGDDLLLVGTAAARRDLQFNLRNDHALEYVLTGRDLPGGWIWEKLLSLRQRRADLAGRVQ